MGIAINIALELYCVHLVFILCPVDGMMVGCLGQGSNVLPKVGKWGRLVEDN